MPKTEYAAFKALDPFFEVVLESLSGLVDGKHYFDTFADDALYESRSNFPGWPQTIQGRAKSWDISGNHYGAKRRGQQELLVGTWLRASTSRRDGTIWL
jgi:hypothetical protein